MIRLNKHMAIPIGDGDGRLISMCDDLFHFNTQECYRTWRGALNELFWAIENRTLGASFV